MNLITYGSLMNKKEFAGKDARLVWVKGWKRIFNKPVTRDVWKDQENALVLNVIPDANSRFNAVMFSVDEDLEKIKEREFDYALVEVPVFDFETKKEIGTGFLFTSRNIISDKKYAPHTKYLEVCREGAYSWGELFGSAFDETTRL